MADVVFSRSTITKGLDAARADLAAHEATLADLQRQREAGQAAIDTEGERIAVLRRQVEQLADTLLVIDAIEAAPGAASTVVF